MPEVSLDYGCKPPTQEVPGRTPLSKTRVLFDHRGTSLNTSEPRNRIQTETGRHTGVLVVWRDPESWTRESPGTSSRHTLPREITGRPWGRDPVPRVLSPEGDPSTTRFPRRWTFSPPDPGPRRKSPESEGGHFFPPVRESLPYDPVV